MSRCIFADDVLLCFHNWMSRYVMFVDQDTCIVAYVVWYMYICKYTYTKLHGKICIFPQPDVEIQQYTYLNIWLYC